MKLLNPIIAFATIATITTPITFLTSCGSQEEEEPDEEVAVNVWLDQYQAIFSNPAQKYKTETTYLFEIVLQHKDILVVAGRHSYCFVPCNDRAVADNYLTFDVDKTKIWVNNKGNTLKAEIDYYFPKDKDGIKLNFTEKVLGINDGDKIFIQTQFSEIKKDAEIYFHFYSAL